MSNTVPPHHGNAWSQRAYLCLVLLTVLLPVVGFIIGLLSIWSPAKRKQAGSLMSLAVLVCAIIALWTLIVLVCFRGKILG